MLKPQIIYVSTKFTLSIIAMFLLLYSYSI